jgi:hypothetical protein
MFDKDVIRIRNASLMDLAVYLTLFIFVGTGFLAPSATERIIVLLLLLVFGLAHRWISGATTSRQVNVQLLTGIDRRVNPGFQLPIF